MRLKLVLLAAAVAATAMPAAAQSYRSHDPCKSQRGENQIAGALLGGILGGVVGSNVAASGHRHDGTAVGAVVGGLVGSQIGKNAGDCRARTYYPSYPQTTYPAPAYGQDYGYDRYPSAYGSSPGYYPPSGYGYDPGYRGHDDYGRGYEYRDTTSAYRGDLYGRGSRDYIPSSDYAGRDCSVATQITRLPDGTEVHRKVDACRDAYYGGWKIED